MKKDRTILVALLILIGLVAWLLVVSINRSNDLQKQIALIKQTQLLQPEPQQPLAPQKPAKNGSDGKDGSSCTTAQTSGGAVVHCSDGTTSTVSNGKNGTNAAPAKNGKSAYELWQEQGNRGSLTDFFNSLKGDSGTDSRPIELRCDPLRLLNEWRPLGTTVWQPLDKVLECAQ
jgi:hypothetical protein